MPTENDTFIIMFNIINKPYIKYVCIYVYMYKISCGR